MIVRGRAAASSAGAAWFGLLLAAAVFVRPIAVAILPVALTRVLRTRPLRRGALLAALILAPTALGLGAWTARNHQRLGSVVILTTNLGAHNAPFFGIDRARIVTEGRQQGLNEAEINDDPAGRDRPGGGPLTRPGGVALRAARARPLLARPALGGAAPAGHPHVRGRPTDRPERSACTARCSSSTTRPTRSRSPARSCCCASGGPSAGVWAILGSYVLLHALVSDGNFRLAAPLYPLLCLFAGHAIAQLGARGGWWAD